ncbi:TonB-dependent receptor [Hymenobacter sp.]|jgi:TonB-linked SusC/RagA family outer membrane protein|uniref:SusC/RagA family TonB-linked outer membrane protein n=1 Tax=Hymenobacter sp. TaxID=1898978 RepID=UPI002EDBAE6C
MEKKLFIPLVCAVAAATPAWAQTRAISGRITGSDGSGIPGVTVLERGTTNGTSTGPDGGFSLTVQPTATLVVSSVGYTTQNVVVGDRTTVAVTLKEDAVALSEAVVIGYGSQAKSEVTGAVTQISGNAVQNVPTVSFEQAIQGRTPGVQINQGSGKLGAGVQIRVRGASSVTASNQPLYVIDGIPVTSNDAGVAFGETSNPLADINPNDIESISILKDAASSAIYGSRASNGVILVTTRKGKQGQTRVNVGAYWGTSKATRTRKFLNSAQYKELFSEAILNSGSRVADPVTGFRGGYVFRNYGANPDVAEVFDAEGGIDYNSNLDTDWAGAAFRKGSVAQYDFNVNGGDAKTRFYISSTFNDQKGIIIGNRYRRGSFRANLDHSISDKLKVGVNVSLVRSVNDRVADDNDFSNPVQLNALPPLQAKYLPDGKVNSSTLYYNNLAELSSTNRSGNYRSISSAFLSYNPIKALTLRTEVGGDFLNINEELYRGIETETGRGRRGYAFESQGNVVNYTTNNTATYARSFNEDHAVEALAGFSFQRYSQKSVSAEGQTFPNDEFRKITSAAKITDGDSQLSEYVFLSYFGRVNYNFREKYLVSGSLRADKSSRFGRDERTGVFPAGSLGWVISNEDFLKGNSIVSLVKLRGSYGLTGNAEITNYASRGLYEAIPYADQAGIRPTQLGNDFLTWENTAQADIGLEFGILKNRISGEVDVYEKKTSDLLLARQLLYTGGYDNIYENLGKMRNRGLELSLNTINLDGVVRWSTNFNISFNRNKVTDLNGQEIISGGRNLSRVRVGEPIGVFYGVKYAGVDPANGDALFYTADGSKTSVYSQGAVQKLGNPNPQYTGGFSNTVSYKDFELSALTQFTYGNDIYNIAGVYQSVNGDYFDNQTTDQLNRWRNPGDITNVPQARYGDANGTQTSSRWIEDGSFFRIKSVTLSYTLPTVWAKKALLQSARVYVTGQNLATITNYKGYDPEVNTGYVGGNTAAGVQSGNYILGHDFYTPPLARTILFGFNLGF